MTTKHINLKVFFKKKHLEIEAVTLTQNQGH